MLKKTSLVVLGMGLALTWNAFTYEPHPMIRAAQKSLLDAQESLKHADRDFGGHRVKAMEHIRMALDELRLAIAADRSPVADAAPIRPGEELDVRALAAYLSGKLPGAGEGLEIRQFPGGHSNLTYLLRAGGREYVLRRPPLGPVAPKAHDMAREYRILRAVHPHFPEAPEPFAVCEDPAVLGAPFFIMERRHGAVVRDRAPKGITPEAASEAFLDTLIRLHAVDIAGADLAALGKPAGYVERQVRGWADRWERARTDDGATAMDDVVRWLAANLPPPLAPTLIHNDYKLDNVMLEP